MEVNLKRFVDIDIQRRVQSTVASTRDTPALLSGTTNSNSGTLYTSYSKVEADFPSDTNVKSFAKLYFDTYGCKKLKIYADTKFNPTNVENLATALIEDVDIENILIYHASATYEQMKQIAAKYEEYKTTKTGIERPYGIYDKLFICGKPSLEKDETTTEEDLISYRHLVVKAYKEELAPLKGEILISKYLNNIDFYGQNVVNDYCYTKETSYFTSTEAENLLKEDSDFENCKASNYNFDMFLADDIVNIGGDTKTGLDIVNEFSVIVLQQLLTIRLVDLLKQKIKGVIGISSIYSVMASELNKFVTNGYLDTTKVYNKPTLTTEKNGITYTLIEEGTPLPLGYYISILPLISLTEEQKTNRSTPDIYIVLSESKGIRTIKIDGEVLE